MRILVMGTGAVGGCYGVMLARAGHDVTFVARGAMLAALRERGLELRAPGGTYRLQPTRAVATPAEAGRESELILFTVKGYDTESALSALRPAIGPTTAVLTLQNGVDSAGVLSAAFGSEPVVVGTTTINAAVLEPGVVEDRGAPVRSTLAELSGAITPRLEAIAAALREAGVETIVQTDPRLGVWQKFVLLAAHATITSATGEALGIIRSAPEGAALYRQLMMEAESVARAEGVPLPPDIVATTHAFIMTMPPQARSSMAIDFARGGRTELEQLTGAIVRRARAAGVPTPGFDALYTVLKVRAGQMRRDA
jgi:2-dehydropantoate 2-reductase